MATQNISMTDELAAFVTEQVSKGNFASVSEVYREALRDFRDRVDAQKQQKDLILTKLKASQQAYERGEYIDLESDEGITSLMTEIGSEVDAEHA